MSCLFTCHICFSVGMSSAFAVIANVPWYGPARCHIQPLLLLVAAHTVGSSVEVRPQQAYLRATCGSQRAPFSQQCPLDASLPDGRPPSSDWSPHPSTLSALVRKPYGTPELSEVHTLSQWVTRRSSDRPRRLPDSVRLLTHGLSSSPWLSGGAYLRRRLPLFLPGSSRTNTSSRLLEHSDERNPAQ